MAEYEITIKIDGGGNGAKNPIAGNDESAAKKGKKKEKSDVLTSGDMATGAYVAYKTVAPYVKSFINFEISQVAIKTGRNEEQAKRQFVANSIEGVLDIAVGTVVAGLSGGPVAAVAVLGTSLIGAAVSYAQRSEQLRAEQNLENISLGLMRTRSGGSIAAYSQSRS